MGGGSGGGGWGNGGWSAAPEVHELFARQGRGQTQVLMTLDEVHEIAGASLRLEYHVALGAQRRARWRRAAAAARVAAAVRALRAWPGVRRTAALGSTSTRWRR